MKSVVIRCRRVELGALGRRMVRASVSRVKSL